MKRVILSMATMVISSGALAGPAWTYIDAGVVLADSSGKDTAAGASLTGSFGLDMFHGSLSYTAISDAVARPVPLPGSGTKGDDYDSVRVAVGLHPAITDSTDMFVELGYTDGSYDDANQDPDGVDLTFGVRSMITDSFELNAAAIISDGSSDTGGDDDVQEAGIRIGGQYFFTDAISVNVAATQGYGAQTGNGSDGDSIQIGGRWNF